MSILKQWRDRNRNLLKIKMTVDSLEKYLQAIFATRVNEEWDNKNDALEPTKYYTLEPNPQAERIDEKDLPKDKLYYVWIADKMFSGYTSTPTSYDFKPLEQVRKEQQKEMDIENNMTTLDSKMYAKANYNFSIGFHNVPYIKMTIKIEDKTYETEFDLQYFRMCVATELGISTSFEFCEIPLCNALQIKSESIHVLPFDKLLKIVKVTLLK